MSPTTDTAPQSVLGSDGAQKDRIGVDRLIEAPLQLLHPRGGLMALCGITNR